MRSGGGVESGDGVLVSVSVSDIYGGAAVFDLFLGPKMGFGYGACDGKIAQPRIRCYSLLPCDAF